jgi:hypothetical protein
MMNFDRPHTAIINIQIEVHSLDDLGQCSGSVLNNNTLRQYGLHSAVLRSVSGKNGEECMLKLKEVMQIIQEACNNDRNQTDDK